MRILSKLIGRVQFITSILSINPLTIYTNLKAEISNRSDRWDIPSSEVMRLSSLSEDGRYNVVCEMATEDDRILDRFRSCVTYRQILEHVSYRHGLKYAKMIPKNSLASEGLLSYKAKWGIGKPATFKYRNYGYISPTLIRYAKVHDDISTLFGELDSFDLLEIGCGFGGQSVQIMGSEKIHGYYFVDLPVVEQLIGKFLAKVEDKYLEKANFSSTESFPDQFDLLISNYAFSELQRDIQDVYIKKYLLKSKRGYMIYNHINPPSFGSYSSAEICEMIPGSQIVSEIPLTDKSNVLIIWGHEKNKIKKGKILK